MKYVSPIPDYVYGAESIGATTGIVGGTTTGGTTVNITPVTPEVGIAPQETTPVPRTRIVDTVDFGNIYFIGPYTEWEIPDIAENVGKGFVWMDEVANGNRVIRTLSPGVGIIVVYHIGPKGNIIDIKDIQLTVNPPAETGGGTTIPGVDTNPPIVTTPGTVINNPPPENTQPPVETTPPADTGGFAPNEPPNVTEPTTSSPTLPTQPTVPTPPEVTAPPIEGATEPPADTTRETKSVQMSNMKRNLYIGGGVLGLLGLGVLAYFLLRRKK